MKRLFALVIVAVFAVTAFTADAGQFPSRQITIVCPPAPGGSSDMTSRIFAAQMEKILNVPVVVVNRPGATNTIGMEFARTRRPDGYTIGYVPVEVAMVRALGLTELNGNDFTYLARAMTIPASITVRKDAPWNTFAEFLAYAKANPGKLKVGNSGTGSIWHIAAADIEQKCGVSFTHVPFDGASLAGAALLGGNVDAIPVAPCEVKAAVDAGDMKVLVVIGEERSNVCPEVATAKEQGYDLTVMAFGTFGVNPDVPKDVLATLEKAAEQAINSKEMKDFLFERGFNEAYLPGADTLKFVQEQQAFYDKLIPALGLVAK